MRLAVAAKDVVETKKSFATHVYIIIERRLRLTYADRERADLLSAYPVSVQADYNARDEQSEFWSSNHYRDLKGNGLF